MAELKHWLTDWRFYVAVFVAAVVMGIVNGFLRKNIATIDKFETSIGM